MPTSEPVINPTPTAEELQRGWPCKYMGYRGAGIANKGGYWGAGLADRGGYRGAGIADYYTIILLHKSYVCKSYVCYQVRTKETTLHLHTAYISIHLPILMGILIIIGIDKTPWYRSQRPYWYGLKWSELVSENWEVVSENWELVSENWELVSENWDIENWYEATVIGPC